MRVPDVTAPTSADEANAALAKADESMAESSRRWPSVRRVTKLQEELNTDYLGARIQETYRSE